jgi:hypothetical protein
VGGFGLQAQSSTISGENTVPGTIEFTSYDISDPSGHLAGPPPIPEWDKVDITLNSGFTGQNIAVSFDYNSYFGIPGAAGSHDGVDQGSIAQAIVPVSGAPTCSQIIQKGTLTAGAQGPVSLSGQPVAMSAIWSPGSGLTLAQAASVCGFSGFDWVQVATTPLPAPIEVPSTTFYDTVEGPSTDIGFYNDPQSNQSSTELKFPCLPGPSGALAPLGSTNSFETELAGVLNGAPVLEPVGFDWLDNFNGVGEFPGLGAAGDANSGVGGVAGYGSNDPTFATTGSGGATVVSVNGQPVAVPEPTSLALIAPGLLCLFFALRRRRSYPCPLPKPSRSRPANPVARLAQSARVVHVGRGSSASILAVRSVYRLVRDSHDQTGASNHADELTDLVRFALSNRETVSIEAWNLVAISKLFEKSELNQRLHNGFDMSGVDG